MNAIDGDVNPQGAQDRERAISSKSLKARPFSLVWSMAMHTLARARLISVIRRSGSIKPNTACFDMLDVVYQGERALVTFDLTRTSRAVRLAV